MAICCNRSRKKFGPVNVLVNNAGIYISDTAENLTAENYRKVIAVNQDSVAFGMRAVVGSMRKGKTGSIINVSSAAGFIGAPAQLAYTASKFAVRGMTKSAAIDLAPTIRVNSVHPGVIRTPILGTVSEEVLDTITKPIPLKRLGEPTELSPLVVFLASDESSFCTGSEFIADGGFLAT